MEAPGQLDLFSTPTSDATADSTRATAIDYQVRTSQRARRPRLEISPFGQVSVVIPARFPQNRVAAFVSEHRDWLNRTLARIGQHQNANPDRFALKPTHVTLAAMQQSFPVHYETGNSPRLTLRPNEGLRLAITQNQDGPRLLQRWLQEMARAHLIPWAQQKSATLELPISSVQIRGQKTRWGSCTSRGVICLNRSLLFLPPELVDYLLVHELCHTRHMNHSKRFWALVHQFEPEFRAKERELSKALRYVPLWATAHGLAPANTKQK